MSVENTQGQLWEVFIQSKNNLPYKHVGSVHASDKEMAIQNARDLYTRRSEGRGIWVVPSNCIVASDPQDEEAMFDPSDDKIYRHATFYKMPEGSQNI